MSAPIPVTIVTGFLGSGKTTLLSSVIARRQTRRLALLINEFGEVSVDGALILATLNDVQGQQPAALRIEELPHGLIAYSDDTLFLPAMQALAARRAVIDHVLIETSGLALPSAVMELLQTPALAADFILDATLVVVDTPLLLADQFEDDADTAQAATATLFAQQLALADVVVLNKIDDLDDAALLLAETRVRQRAPNVRFLELAYQARLDIRLALGLRLHQVTRQEHGFTDTVYTALPGNYLNGHAHSGMAAHSHGLATHRHFHEQDPGWLSFTLRSAEPQTLLPLQAALIEAARCEPILRCKGFAHSADASLLVQGVRARVQVTQAETAAGPVSAPVSAPVFALTSELIFIGYHVSRARVANLLSTMTATDWS